LQGPDKEVFFEQEHVAGREAAIDFTECTSLRVTIAGRVFAHLLFQFILSFSKWRSVSLAFSETFEALVAGLQRALWELGGVPSVLRSDNLSAATHELPSGGRELNRRFQAVLDHYGVRSTRIEPGKSHQNGVVEKAHDRLKSALDQALILRGSRDFADVGSYLEWFRNRREARAIIEDWRQHYNHVRPHSSLGYMTPNEFRATSTPTRFGEAVLQ
jgi:transposase InsO family protein